MTAHSHSGGYGETVVSRHDQSGCDPRRLSMAVSIAQVTQYVPTLCRNQADPLQ
jgi:hypothetical protein